MYFDRNIVHRCERLVSNALFFLNNLQGNSVCWHHYCPPDLNKAGHLLV